MGLRHKATRGTTIEANGVKVTVLRGSPQLEISAPSDTPITIGHAQIEPQTVRRRRTRPTQAIATRHMTKYDADIKEGPSHERS